MTKEPFPKSKYGNTVGRDIKIVLDNMGGVPEIKIYNADEDLKFSIRLKSNSWTRHSTPAEMEADKRNPLYPGGYDLHQNYFLRNMKKTTGIVLYEELNEEDVKKVEEKLAKAKESDAIQRKKYEKESESG